MSQYFDQNPDVLAEGCIVTGLHEPGVVFPEIEPVGHTHCFIGRSSLIEATAQVLGATPDAVNAIPENLARIAQLEAQVAQLEAVRDRYVEMYAAVRAAFDAVPADPAPSELDEPAPPPKPKAAPKRRKAPAPADLE